MQLTLLQRPGRLNVDDFNNALQKALSELESKLSAKARITGFSGKGWAKVEVTGDDHEILEELIYREFSPAVSSFASVNPHGNYCALIRDMHRESCEVDIGIETPKVMGVKISVDALRAQLCDGNPSSLEEIAENYCLQPESKITIRITRLDQDTKTVEGWLADSQLKYFTQAIASNLERVQVFNCTRAQVDSAMRRANLERDVVSVETMTLTSHSIICKLGTDAIGLIPKLGALLRKSELKPFIPRRITSRCRKW